MIEVEAKFIIVESKKRMYNSYITFILYIRIPSGKDLLFSVDINKFCMSDFIGKGINLRKKIGKGGMKRIYDNLFENFFLYNYYKEMTLGSYRVIQEIPLDPRKLRFRIMDFNNNLRHHFIGKEMSEMRKQLSESGVWI